MPKEKITIGIVFLIVGVICVILPFFLSYEDVDTFTVSALTTQPVIFHLKMRDRVEGYFTVRGGANDDIPFWVEDPLGNRIVDPGIVYSYYSFSFTAGMDGDYYLYFDNTISMISSKTISLTARIFLTGAFFTVTVLGVLLMVIGLSLSIMGAIMKPKLAVEEALEKKSSADAVERKTSKERLCKRCGKKYVGNPVHSLTFTKHMHALRRLINRSIGSSSDWRAHVTQDRSYYSN